MPESRSIYPLERYPLLTSEVYLGRVYTGSLQSREKITDDSHDFHLITEGGSGFLTDHYIEITMVRKSVHVTPLQICLAERLARGP